jgi:long-chain fatty acid transport protein
MRRKLPAILVAFLLFLPHTILATDGYFSTGFGIKQVGHGGAGIAFPLDSLSGATNPAGMFFAGDRVDLGVTFFQPIRYAEIVGNQLPPGYPDINGSYSGNGKKNFFIPELGYNHLFNPRLSFGVSIYGNGGMNTNYPNGVPLFGTSRAGVDLEQLFVAPTVAYKPNEHNAIGASFNLGYQRFQAEGLQNFANSNFSNSPGNVTNRGYNNSFGVGFRVGWLGKITDYLSVGATYQSRTYMQKLDNYQGLFAEQGGFDIPASVGAGVAVRVHPRVTAVFDYERIFYGTVRSIANLGSNQALLGANNGPGFGWQDISVQKVGADVKVTSKWVLRAGYNHSGVPFNGTQTFFNVLAPAVVQNHFTAGATWTFAGNKELNFAYQHAFGNTVYGVNSIPPFAGGGNANLTMHQNSFGISFGWDRNKHK